MAAAAGMTKDLVQAFVLVKDPCRIEELWTEMYDDSFWAKGGGPIVFAGISAIEQALWGIKGRAPGRVSRRQASRSRLYLCERMVLSVQHARRVCRRGRRGAY